MELYIYNDKTECIGVLQNFTSIQWLKCYQETGEFEIHCAETPENVLYLKENNRLLKNDDMTIGFIKYVYNNAGEIELRGYLDNLGDRVNYNTAHIVNVEKDLYALVNNNKRKLDIRTASLKGLPDKINETETTYKVLRDTFKGVCSSAGLGYRIIKKGSDWNVVELYKKGKNENVIFSEDFNNIVAQSYLRDIAEYKNYAIVAGEGQGKDRKIVYVDRTNGGQRYELFVDADDLSMKYTTDTGEEKSYTETQYKDLLKERGNQKLDELKIIEEFQVEFDQNNESFIYRQDFDLGDIVKVKSVKYEFVKWMRLSKVKEIFENGSRSLIFTLSIEK